MGIRSANTRENAVDAFMEKSHWFDLEEGQFIQGLVAHYNDEKRIYVVTVEPDALNKQLHNRWPRIIGQ